MLSPEEYILDFKAEEKKTHTTVFDIEDIESDSSTVSASEVDSNAGNSPTPPLLCKLKKARVMIKKLPLHILEKYKMSNSRKTISSKTKSSSTSCIKPSRISKRKGAKTVPGLYLSLHVNKPLNEVLNVKKRSKRTFLNTGRIPLKLNKQKLVTHDKKSLRLSQKSKASTKKSIRTVVLERKGINRGAKTIANEKNCSAKSSTSARTSGLRKTNKDCQFTKPLPPKIPNISPLRPTCSKPTLHERIAATRLINKEDKIKRLMGTSTLPNCPDVVITKYNLPPNMQTARSQFTATHSVNSLVYNPAVVPSLQTLYQAYQDPRLLSTPQHNITIQVPASFAPSSTLTNFSQIQSSDTTNTFPTLIMSAPRRLPTMVNTATTILNQSPIIPTELPTSSVVQNSLVTPKANDSIMMDSPKILVINQPVLRNDPLDEHMKTRNVSERQREHYDDSDMETCIQSESEDLEMSDSEQHSSNSPEVIKRIIYHTKSVQTKFTCNGTICGLVDSEEFNLNCFYCYEIFPLRKWWEFKEHIKIVHQIEEKANETEEEEAEAEAENLKTQPNPTTNSKTQTINLKPNTLNSQEEILIQAQSPLKDDHYKKLPLEPRLVAQREQKLNRMHSEPAKNSIIPPNKSPAKQPSKQLNQSNQSNCYSIRNISTDLDDDIISLGSDNGDDDLQLVDDVTENVEEYKQKVNKSLDNNSNLKNANSLIDDVTKLIPPHITIKKLSKPCTNESVNTNKTTALEKSISFVKPFINKAITETAKTHDTSLDEPFIKVPSNFNIQRVIKYIPKPTTEKSTGVESTKPRYFVVKKIVKPATKTPSLNVSKGIIFTQKSKKDDDDMPSNDENEDAMPKPTNGCGILFGLTNPMVVIEFLLKLKSFPELWRPQVKNNSVNYDESIKKLCFHLNSRFDLNIQDFEMRLSIQRVKDWYCRMLKKIHEHNRSSNNMEPFKHKFPLYFKILNQFLTSDVHYTNNLLLSSRFKSDTNINKYPKWMVYKTGTSAPKTNAFHLEEKVAVNKKEEINNSRSLLKKEEINNSRSLLKKEEINNSRSLLKPQITAGNTPVVQKSIATATSTTSPVVKLPPVTDTAANVENNDSLIEFDADVLYENESSDEEVLEPFDETKLSNKKISNTNESPKRRTKTYLGSFECDVCQKVYKRRCDLRRHRIHHFPPQFECGICSQKFFFKHWAEKCNHLRKRKYNIIKRAEKSDADGNDSVETVIPKKWPKKVFRFKLICEICGASYRQIGSLNCHKRDKHLNQRLKCVVCSFTALTNYRIVQHQKKRHIVEPGTVEEVAKKSRARTDTKTPFSVEARQEFDWRREMRKKLQPGEKFFACCKCRIIFNSRKEKVLHNKLEHPIKETSVVCLLCLPNKFLLSNSNSARRHYTDIHKVPWDEIDALVKRTKPVFNILSKEEIELLNASENWKELLEELIKDRELEPVEKIKTQVDEEAIQAIQNLPHIGIESEIEVNKIDVECATKEEENVYVDNMEEGAKEEHVYVDGTEDAAKEDNHYVDGMVEEPKEENVYVDCIIDHDYNNEEMVYSEQQLYTAHNNNNEHDYSEEQVAMENYENYEEINEQNNDHNNKLYEASAPNVIVEGVNASIAYNIECTEDVVVHQHPQQNEQEYLQSIVDDFVDDEMVDGELVEECIVVEECIEDVIDEEEEYF